MPTQNYHLVPSGNRWILSLEGRNVAVGEFDSKDLALAAFSAGEEPSTLKIHTADGAILEERETGPSGSGTGEPEVQQHPGGQNTG
jgi:hypothetical protein